MKNDLNDAKSWVLFALTESRLAWRMKSFRPNWAFTLTLLSVGAFFFRSNWRKTDLTVYVFLCVEAFWKEHWGWRSKRRGYVNRTRRRHLDYSTCSSALWCNNEYFRRVSCNVKILNKDVYFNVSILILFVYIFIAYIKKLLRFFRAVQTSRVHNSIYAR